MFELPPVHFPVHRFFLPGLCPLKMSLWDSLIESIKLLSYIETGKSTDIVIASKTRTHWQARHDMERGILRYALWFQISDPREYCDPGSDSRVCSRPVEPHGDER